MRFNIISHRSFVRVELVDICDDVELIVDVRHLASHETIPALERAMADMWRAWVDDGALVDDSARPVATWTFTRELGEAGSSPAPIHAGGTLRTWGE